MGNKAMIDPKKLYRTRDGREVRIYAVDGGEAFPVHGAVDVGDGEWTQENWTQNGFWCGGEMKNHHLDLIEVKPRIQREVWVNVYPDCVGMVCESKEEADNATGAKSGRRIACVRLTIDCEEGHGLD